MLGIFLVLEIFTLFNCRFQIFRHGERNIERTYPNDPFQDEATFWPGGYGALTNVRFFFDK